MTERKVRVRFAPSPTGPLHIGGVRTALYNYLFAKQHGGDLVFRIEDTDSTRFVPGAEDYIIEAFNWLGIKFDEGVSFGGNYGPYRQSERRDTHKKYVQQLLDNGKAYIAFDTPEELDTKRKEIENFQYDNKTRGQMRNSLTLSKEEVDQLIADGKQYVVRFKIDAGEEVLVDDLILLQFLNTPSERTSTFEGTLMYSNSVFWKAYSPNVTRLGDKRTYDRFVQPSKA